MFSRSRSEPSAIAKARKLVGRRLSKAIPGYRFGFVLALEPDQYRVSFTLWDEWRGGIEVCSVRRLSLSAHELGEWHAWLDGGKC
jgi:hypothetical protein